MNRFLRYTAGAMLCAAIFPLSVTAVSARETITPKPHPKTTVSQGLYEIEPANGSCVLEVGYCTVHEEDSHELQLYPQLDVNQQKFYFEALPGNVYRISSLGSGEALTAGMPHSQETASMQDGSSSDGTANASAFDDSDSSAVSGTDSFSLPVCTSSVQRKGGRAVEKSQIWLLEDAGDGLVYLRARSGRYLTLASSSPHCGADVELRNFTGKLNQKWKLSETWISSEAHADTDLINPWQKGGSYDDLRLTLTFGTTKELLTASELAEWIVETEDHTLQIDPSRIAEWVEHLAETYNTQGRERLFRTTGGEEITLYKGNFGWKLDVEQTIDAIKRAARRGGRVTLDPIWAHEGVSFTDTGINDIGDSYIEVDLHNQKVWLYRDGQLLIESDCVTGTYGTDRQTPGGVYSIYYRQSPAVLRGADYTSPVEYWMAFYEGYGLHDANWRSSFGGDIYLYDGSHGCVNLPDETARILYENCPTGYPVVLYN